VGLRLYFGASKKKNFLPRWDSEPVSSTTKQDTKPTDYYTPDNVGYHNYDDVIIIIIIIIIIIRAQWLWER
jgi:hypothetical protein